MFINAYLKWIALAKRKNITVTEPHKDREKDSAGKKALVEFLLL